MKTIKLFFLSIILIPGIIKAQEMTLGITGGTNSFLGNSYYSKEIGWPGLYEINGVTTVFTGLGFHNELNLGLVLNYKLSQIPISFALDINYSQMRGKGTWPVWDLKNIDLPPKYSEIGSRMDYYSIELSSRYYFELNNFEPYISVAGIMNYLGDINAYLGGNKFYVNGYGMRFGLGIGTGIDYKLTEKIIANGNIIYNMANLKRARNGEDKFNFLRVSFGVFYKIM